MYLHSLDQSQIPAFIPEVKESDFEDSSGKKLLPTHLFDSRFACLSSSYTDPDEDSRIASAQLVCDISDDESDSVVE